MTLMKPRKILNKAFSGSKNLHFDDLVALVLAFGFAHKRTSGSHRIFKHPVVADLLSLQPTKDNKAKPYQIKQLLALVEAYNLKLGDEVDEEAEEDDE
jgi:predicted RNA binding protein YcfA (HicA-like mRNA interferase family)